MMAKPKRDFAIIEALPYICLLQLAYYFHDIAEVAIERCSLEQLSVAASDMKTWKLTSMQLLLSGDANKVSIWF